MEGGRVHNKKKPQSLKPKDVKARQDKIVELKATSPKLTEKEIAAIVGCDQSTVNRQLKKFEHEYSLMETDIQLYTDNEELILAGTEAKLIQKINESMHEYKPRELPYAFKQIADVRDRRNGQISSTGSIDAMLNVIDEMASARLKAKEKSQTIEVEAEIIEEEK